MHMYLTLIFIGMQIDEILLGNVILFFFFFIQKTSPRTTSRMTNNTEVTEPATMEVFVRARGVFAWTLVDVVVLVLREIKISS